MSHTQEPWSYGEDNDGWYVEADGNQIAHGLSEANARRIVACLNRLAAYKTEDIEDPGCDLTGYGALMSKLWHVEKQRDDLLAELLRVKEICLRECGVGIVNETVIARIKAGVGQRQQSTSSAVSGEFDAALVNGQKGGA